MLQALGYEQVQLLDCKHGSPAGYLWLEGRLSHARAAISRATASHCLCSCFAGSAASCSGALSPAVTLLQCTCSLALGIPTRSAELSWAGLVQACVLRTGCDTRLMCCSSWGCGQTG